MKYKVNKSDINLTIFVSIFKEKETLCFTQRAELDKITVERDALLTRLDERAQRERELQEKLQAAGDKSHSLEKLVADLGRRIEEKDESLERLKDEMMTNTVIEKVSIICTAVIYISRFT